MQPGAGLLAAVREPGGPLLGGHEVAHELDGGALDGGVVRQEEILYPRPREPDDGGASGVVRRGGEVGQGEESFEGWKEVAPLGRRVFLEEREQWADGGRYGEGAGEDVRGICGDEDACQGVGGNP